MAKRKQVATNTPMRKEPKITNTKEEVKLQKIKFKDTATAFCTAKIATKIYGAEGVEYSEEAEKTIQGLEKNGYGNMPVCIAKTQYSFSDDAKNLLCLEPFKIHVKSPFEGL